MSLAIIHHTVVMSTRPLQKLCNSNLIKRCPDHITNAQTVSTADSAARLHICRLALGAEEVENGLPPPIPSSLSEVVATVLCVAMADAAADVVEVTKAVSVSGDDVAVSRAEPSSSELDDVAVSRAKPLSSELDAVSSARISLSVLEAVALECVDVLLLELYVVEAKVVDELVVLPLLDRVVVDNEIFVVAGSVAVPSLDMVVVEDEVIVLVVFPPAEDADCVNCGFCTERTELGVWTCSSVS